MDALACIPALALLASLPLAVASTGSASAPFAAGAAVHTVLPPVMPPPVAARPSTRQQEPHAADQVTDMLVRIGGPIRVAAGDTVNTVVVVDDTATVDGVVREQLVVVGGTARVSGTVEGNVAAAGGEVVLLPGARIGRDVLLYRSGFTRAPDARVEGIVRERHPFGVGRVLGWLFWLGGTVFVIVAGLAFAALAGRQLRDAAALISRRTGATVLAAFIVAIGLPLLAVLAILTLIGLPIGLMLLLLVLPVLALLGYIVTGHAVGAALLRRIGGEAAMHADAERPYLAVTAGVALLQIIALIPLLGPLVTLVTAPLGAGALLYRSWRVLRTRPPRPEAARRAA